MEDNSQKEEGSKQPSQLSLLLARFRSQIDLLGEKCGVNGNIIFGIIICCLISVFIGYFENIITNIVGILYPAYWSIKSLENKKIEDKQWLTYWVVFSLFVLVETLFGFLLKYIPFYTFIKLAFLLWLFLPNYRGAQQIYDNFVIKLFKKYEVQIENTKNQFEDKLKSTYNSEFSQYSQLSEENRDLYRMADSNKKNQHIFLN